VDLHRAILEAISFLSRTIDERITVTHKFQAGKQTTVMGDPDQIQQVLLNIALNGRDAMPDGGELHFETDVVDLDAEYCRWHMGSTPGVHVMIAITDTGQGIPREILDRIFEPFFTTKEPGKGTGLGLAMIYGIIKNHGGSIRVYSEVGHGTTFRVYLPLAAAAATPHHPGDTKLLEPIIGQGRILLVDDDPIVRQASTGLLQLLGYEVVICEDGQMAVDYYREHGREIDLVLLDLVMPRLGGLETFRALKAIDPSVKVVLTTGYGHNEAVQALLDEGVVGFAPKPYHARTLSEMLARILGRKG
jgi:CheY-like chemotaxis protein